MSLTITSAEFTHNGHIPSEFTFDGVDTSPTISWTGAPPGTKSLILILEDLDAPDPAAPQEKRVHWILYDIPSSATALEKSVSCLPYGTHEGVNDWEHTGYDGPCDHTGKHHYHFRLYALNTVFGDIGTPTKDALISRMKTHVIEKTELIGTY